MVKVRGAHHLGFMARLVGIIRVRMCILSNGKTNLTFFAQFHQH